MTQKYMYMPQHNNAMHQRYLRLCQWQRSLDTFFFIIYFYLLPYPTLVLFSIQRTNSVISYFHITASAF